RLFGRLHREMGEPSVPNSNQKPHFGSLANEEAVQKIKEVEKQEPDKKEEHMDLDSIDNPMEREVMAEFERRRRARTLTLPTDDGHVKLLLRKLNEPICLFGEDKLDRKERLRTILSTMPEDEVTRILHSSDEAEQVQQRDTSTWYHKGPAALRDARVEIADFSLKRAQQRLAKARKDASSAAHQTAVAVQEMHRWVASLSVYGSQVADLRPVSYCEFSPDSQHLITSGWSGECGVWSVPSCERERKYVGHSSQAGCARFHPGAYISQEPFALNAASCAHDGTVKLWSLESNEPLSELEQHPQRVARVAFHPSGRFLATCCFDCSWRLVDVDYEQEVLFQEGHSRPVFHADFQCDGSLILTLGMDCYGRVWDLRTGRCIMFLEGHSKEIHCGQFLPNGYQMVTGSADNSCMVWDLRIRRSIKPIAAHTSLVSGLKVDAKGLYMVTSSFDNSLKIWETSGWRPLRQLMGHDTKVMGVDISPNGKWVASVAFDRTFKLWTKQLY
uniref:Pre-mRNA processing factor 4 (PRP4)-like domain-containing protein n=2 Tax=Parascaris univalens TaxID=6257 RepID=A0A915BQY1_PARUN